MAVSEPTTSETTHFSNGTVTDSASPAAAHVHGASLALMPQEEFDRKNERRFVLIQRKHRGGLSSEEEAELQQLQKELRAHVDARFPLPPVDPELLQALTRKLEEAHEGSQGA